MSQPASPRHARARVSLPRRVGHVLRRANRRQRRRPYSRLGRFASLLVVVMAGVMMAISAQASRGSDLRPDRNNDLVDLVRSRAQRNTSLAAELERQRAEVDELASQTSDTGGDHTAHAEVAARAGLTPVKGPAVKVTLTDAPLSVKPRNLDEDLLVVHQQDIQMVVNELWAAGAEAMTIQGQRVTTLTGIKCVGNTVVLRGVPYAPPYEIVAIGDPQRLEAGLAASHGIAVYKQYVEAYRLGYRQQRLATVTLPGHQGLLDLAHATAER